MWKKMVIFAGLLYVSLGMLSAQGFIHTLYQEYSLSDFNEWRRTTPGGEEKKFKISALFNSAEDTSFRFIDSDLEDRLELETEFSWPQMQSGQPVTLYVTARGPWVWDRQLDAIDYGNNRLVQVETGKKAAGENPGGDSPAAAFAENRPPARGPASVPAPSDPAPSRAARPASGGRDVPVTNPTVSEIASSREKPAEGSAASADFDYGRAPRTVPRQVVVQISGQPPRKGRYYRLQVGSFSVPGNATKAADNLKKAGLNPAFEEYQSNVRVVLSRVPGEEVVETARKIGGAGFSEVWCREEP
jgi:hypothetical protein